jgi:chorismate mutase
LHFVQKVTVTASTKSINTKEFTTKELRDMIEDIDQQIIESIATRMEIADELAKAKKKSEQGYWDENKEREVIQRYHELCEDVSLSEDEATQIAEVILKISKDRQRHYFETKS